MDFGRRIRLVVIMSLRANMTAVLFLSYLLIINRYHQQNEGLTKDESNALYVNSMGLRVSANTGLRALYQLGCWSGSRQELFCVRPVFAAHYVFTHLYFALSLSMDVSNLGISLFCSRNASSFNSTWHIFCMCSNTSLFEVFSERESLTLLQIHLSDQQVYQLFLHSCRSASEPWRQCFYRFEQIYHSLVYKFPYHISLGKSEPILPATPFRLIYTTQLKCYLTELRI